MNSQETITCDKAYRAWLGFYNSQRRIGWDKAELVAVGKGV